MSFYMHQHLPRNLVKGLRYEEIDIEKIAAQLPENFIILYTNVSITEKCDIRKSKQCTECK